MDDFYVIHDDFNNYTVCIIWRIKLKNNTEIKHKTKKLL